MTNPLNYGNWIRKKILLGLGLSSLGLAILALLPMPALLRGLAAAAALALFVSFLFPLYAYWAFSPKGGHFQDTFYSLLIQHLHTESVHQALDIGAGNGILSIRLAQRFPAAAVTGMDYWGKDWEYSRQVCEDNAAIAKVSGRITFVRGDAAALDFPEAAFDAVVSNLTFHEVKSAADKRSVVREALRVLQPGGSFAFIDYFYDQRLYGSASEFKEFLDSLGLERVELKPIGEVLSVPFMLRNSRALGKVGIVFGKK
jgi:ubiquinone/menaquinone biosynthesis C-methylase UbiE